MPQSFIQIKLEAFEGPFDLLFQLIEKNQINLYDIPVAELTRQYMEVLRAFPEDMENRSAFLVMAATLLEIKSRMLLPKQPKEKDEKDPRDDLVQKLIEYKYFKQLSELLRECEKAGSRYYYRDPESSVLRLFQGKAKPDWDWFLQNLSWDCFYRTYTDVMTRRENRTDKVRAGFSAVTKDEHTIDDEIEYLLKLLKHSRRLEFTRLFYACPSKSEKIVLFLALLELSKLKLVEISQDDVFQEIVVDKRLE